MIDIENRIIAAVSERLAAKWPGMRLHSEEMRYPAEFPCAELYEMDNYVLESARDSGDIENFAQVTFRRRRTRTFPPAASGNAARYSAK